MNCLRICKSERGEIHTPCPHPFLAKQTVDALCLYDLHFVSITLKALFNNFSL